VSRCDAFPHSGHLIFGLSGVILAVLSVDMLPNAVPFQAFRAPAIQLKWTLKPSAVSSPTVS
jgi:hypothetical protein